MLWQHSQDSHTLQQHGQVRTIRVVRLGTVAGEESEM